MTVDEFKRQLNELSTVISDGVAYFSAWQGLMVEDEASAQALNRYRCLFLPARNALLWMALMQFAKAFDRDPRTVSLRSLLSAAKKDHGSLAPFGCEDELVQIETRLESNAALLIRLQRLRSQRIAHHDAIAAGDRSLLYGEVQRLVEEMKSLYNSLRRLHDRNIWSFDHLVHQAEWHTSEIVRIMREEMDRDTQRIREADRLLP